MAVCSRAVFCTSFGECVRETDLEQCTSSSIRNWLDHLLMLYILLPTQLWTFSKFNGGLPDQSDGATSQRLTSNPAVAACHQPLYLYATGSLEP